MVKANACSQQGRPVAHVYVPNSEFHRNHSFDNRRCIAMSPSVRYKYSRPREAGRLRSGLQMISSFNARNFNGEQWNSSDKKQTWSLILAGPRMSGDRQECSSSAPKITWLFGSRLHPKPQFSRVCGSDPLQIPPLKPPFPVVYGHA
ncbi:hypothetical protein CIRG_07801 [Coccidioides immitis RMSCC 2394]|uniref:Uncharacterized protein n=1 Tax=Coccidioides immitis RMSCC 2394 TaxID=404692 RepID=A0A0J6YKC5_COCIT|nr:hypothetical protein CIRG_07801 [Coccidioides immitis RMSCC 2394]